MDFNKSEHAFKRVKEIHVLFASRFFQQDYEMKDFKSTILKIDSTQVQGYVQVKIFVTCTRELTKRSRYLAIRLNTFQWNITS